MWSFNRKNPNVLKVNILRGSTLLLTISPQNWVHKTIDFEFGCKNKNLLKLILNVVSTVEKYTPLSLGLIKNKIYVHPHKCYSIHLLKRLGYKKQNLNHLCELKECPTKTKITSKYKC